MISKKNPRFDVHAKSGFFFQLSLACILIVVNAAFEWKTYEELLPVDLTEWVENYEGNYFNSLKETPLPLPKPSEPTPNPVIKDLPFEEKNSEVLLEVSLDVE